MSAGVLGLFHPVVTVSNMDSALEFYTGILGLRVTFDEVHAPAVIEQLMGYPDADVRAVVCEGPDGSEIELAEFRRPRGSDRVTRDWCDAGVSMLTFRVADLSSVADDLRAAGYAFTSQPVVQSLPGGEVLRAAYCIGPDGITICLSELPTGRRSLAEGQPS
jgi:catechol 2,3-dioxygenase-like lactoylglutathione lyase family enzyme